MANGDGYTYGGTTGTCGVLHSHVIPCGAAHPDPTLPPGEAEGADDA